MLLAVKSQRHRVTSSFLQAAASRLPVPIVFRRFEATASALDAQGKEKKRMTVLFGTQTGNAGLFARQLAKEARKKYGYACDLQDMFEYDPSKLSSEELVVLITSSFGEGEPPDNAKNFFAWLKQPHRATMFENVKYTVFGLGALRSYGSRYQAAPKELDKIMHDLGGIRILKRGEGNSDGGDMEGEFRSWADSLWKHLEGGHAAAPEEYKCQYTVKKEDKSIPLRPKIAGSALNHHAPVSAHNPFFSRVADNYELHTEKSPRSAHHIALDITGSNIKYDAGDWLGVLPENPDQLVERCVHRLHISDPQEPFTLHTIDEHPDAKAELFSKPMTMWDALKYATDLTSLATKEAVKAMAASAQDQEEKKKLELLASFSAEGNSAFQSVVRRRWSSTLNLLEEFPSVQMTLPQLLEVSSEMKHRFYSISSSPLAFPTQIHVSVGIVRDPNPRGIYEGVSSNWLARISPGSEQAVPIYVRQSLFRLPKDKSIPVIFIAGGVGLAPFRAFLQEMRERKASGEQINPCHLYFGCRNREHDFIYKEEIEQYLKEGILTSFVPAFSHETERLIFIQDRLVENENVVYNMLKHEQGSIMICGNAQTVGEGAFNAFVKIMAKGDGTSLEEATTIVKEIQKEGRYLQDVF